MGCTSTTSVRVTMAQFEQYKRVGLSEMRPVTSEEVANGCDATISISEADLTNGSPKPGDMIARNPLNHNDQWLVAKQYFEDNLTLVTEAEVTLSKSGKSMTFSQALHYLKEGHKVARKGWNGKGMWLTIIPAGNASFKGYDMQDCIGMKTADNNMQPGWLASQNDLLSSDWEIIYT